MQFIQKMIPDAFRENHRDTRGIYFVLTINAYVFLVSCAALPLSWAYQFYSGFYVLLAAAFLSFTFPILVRFVPVMNYVSNYFAAGSWGVYVSMIAITGGLHSPFLIWLLTIPPVVLLYMRRYHAYFWSTMTTITFFVFGFLDITEFWVVDHLPPSWFTYVLLISYSLVLYVIIGTVKAYRANHRKLLQRLKTSNQDLVQSNQELERFAYIASHDMKSPLRNIVSFLNLFERRYGDKVDGVGKEYLQIVSTNAKQMNHLIEDILEYSKTNSKQLKEENINLDQLVTLVAHQVRHENDYPNAIVEFGKLPTIRGDKTMFTQLFQNMLENGLKYNNQEVPKVKIDYTNCGVFACFTFTDNGIGIPDEFLGQIFEMFRRLHNQSDYPGTGIGLAICQKIIDQYGGTIKVESEVGVGTKFTVSFPASIVQSEFSEPQLVQLGAVG